MTKLVTILIFLTAAAASNAAVIHVDANAINNGGTGSQASPYLDLQTAIAAAQDYDTILIAQGTYTGEGNRDLNIDNLKVTITSEDPNNPDVVAATIIDCQGSSTENHRAFTIENAQADLIIEGLTITGGYAPIEDLGTTSQVSAGGAILCKNATPIIRKNVFTDCIAEHLGGAITCFQSNAEISDCTFTANNTYQYGGAVYSIDSSPTISDSIFTENLANDGGAISVHNNVPGATLTPKVTKCIFYNNIASTSGGALFNYSCQITIDRCEFATNDAYYGGALALRGELSTVTNTVIIDNLANGEYGGGIDCYSPTIEHITYLTVTNCTIIANISSETGGGISCYAGNANVQNSIIRDNFATYGPEIALLNDIDITSSVNVSYSNIKGADAGIDDLDGNLVWQATNMDIDPQFAAFDIEAETSTWDLHLKSTAGRYDIDNGNWVKDAISSICLDAADPAADYSAEKWPNGKRANMGAYGATNQASKNGNIADLDTNGTVDELDLMKVAQNWLGEPTEYEDLSDDGTVNLPDLAIIAQNWM